ncbi:MAG: aminotransferase class V-fold PLP-dependent enzyme [Roseitalea sp.]|nr:aminotransferase class V-fold PLP-dependent enzyme [Roseitalea sp.]MBO6720783.1 aminotransferase class V-fold PLP-dependent enzyme [Roseitalea sp.]MBO6743930.1 aminotransferase class V-fold PLP-dependent enzyme [Roseitalea sp.]
MRMSGRHFLQIPGPSNCPTPVLAALAKPTIDHRGPEFRALIEGLLPKVAGIFATKNPVVIFPSSGTGAWEAALVNTLSPGDRILMYETGWFAKLWSDLAERLGLLPEVIRGDWRGGADPAAIAARLKADHAHEIKAVCVVHNETSTGAVTSVPQIRAAIDEAEHSSLLLVDTISSLGSLDYRHDEWGVDVTISGSQKGLMLPPGISFNAVSDRALDASGAASHMRSYWDWAPIIEANEKGLFPYTPNTNLLQALDVALNLMLEEGLAAIRERHSYAGAATRAAVRHWGLELQCVDEAAQSDVLTAVRLPEGHSADDLRETVLARSNMSLGSGLGQLTDKVFRMGHLGDFNLPQILGMIAAVELGLTEQQIPFRPGATEAALQELLSIGH